MTTITKITLPNGIVIETTETSAVRIESPRKKTAEEKQIRRIAHDLVGPPRKRYKKHNFGLKKFIQQFIVDGYFNEPKTAPEVYKHCSEMGWQWDGNKKHRMANVSSALHDLAEYKVDGLNVVGRRNGTRNLYKVNP